VNYEVVWSKNAEDELATIWNNSPHRARITAAARLLDERLESRAEGEGESRSQNTRVAFEFLSAFFIGSTKKHNEYWFYMCGLSGNGERPAINIFHFRFVSFLSIRDG
jgi:hypothetical protein